MAFNPSQPRIPKGAPGAGRFMKIGTALSAATHAGPSGSGRRGGGRAAPLARAGGALTGKETKAQLREIAAGEGITVGRGSREQMAQTIRDFRYNREHGGARLFGETDFARELRENPITPTPRRQVAAPARRTGPAIVDEANKDLAGQSTAQLRAVAAAEGIPVTKGAGKQTLVNEISHGRNVRHRGGGRLLARTDM